MEQKENRDPWLERIVNKETGKLFNTEVKNIRKFIALNGFFVNFEPQNETLPEVILNRAVLDRAVADVLLSGDINNEFRKDSIEWFMTSAFDRTCYDADFEPVYVFKVIQRVFDIYKESEYGRTWKKPTVHPTRVSVIIEPY